MKSQQQRQGKMVAKQYFKKLTLFWIKNLNFYNFFTGTKAAR